MHGIAQVLIGLKTHDKRTKNASVCLGKGEDMAEELEKTCENCEYESEDMEGTHCRHCIHNAEEHFAPKINHEKEIRAKAIDEFAEMICIKCEEMACTTTINGRYMDILTLDGITDEVMEIAEQLKGGE